MSTFRFMSNPESGGGSYAASLTVVGAVVDTVLTNSFTDADGNIVTPSSPARAIRIGTTGSGNLKVEYSSGVVDVIGKLVAGQVLTGIFRKVYASGSDVQDITIFW